MDGLGRWLYLVLVSCGQDFDVLCDSLHRSPIGSNILQNTTGKTPTVLSQFRPSSQSQYQKYLCETRNRVIVWVRRCASSSGGRTFWAQTAGLARMTKSFPRQAGCSIKVLDFGRRSLFL